MTAGKKAEQQKVVEKLQDALDRLNTDVKRVEIWAGALTGFAQPVPDYSETAAEKHRLGRDDHGAPADPSRPEGGDPH